MTKVLVAGTFDIIHPGHINLIEQAKELGALNQSLRSGLGSDNFLVVIIARDENVKKMKGRNPYFDENKRLNQLKDVLSKTKRPGDWKVVLGDLDDPYKIIKQEKPDVIGMGYDQQNYVKGLHDLAVNSDLHFKIERLKPFKEDVCKGKSIRKALEDEQARFAESRRAGFLLINKPMDWTSHDVVAKLRSITGIKQIGHTGTLDPFATGLLICAIGQATKIAGVFNVLSKIYEAAITLGVTSDTYDRTGKIPIRPRAHGREVNPKFHPRINRGLNNSQISKSKIQNILKSFIGKQQQLPPMFSAKKVDGKKLYEIARQGKTIARKPSEIEIYKIELLRYKIQPTFRQAQGGARNKQIPNPKSQIPNFEIRIVCSTGTYIRTLAHDIGQKLGTGAILEELKRTAIGDFNINEAVRLDQLTKDNYSKYLIKPLEAINRVNEFYARYVFR
ncbi:tRNA pseudouridine(55) synthase TruB [Patescibacteria group bacterium]|nr:tRNA pseudouridine(55) synthase TruB [Patescibacteria group bacterium]